MDAAISTYLHAVGLSRAARDSVDLEAVEATDVSLIGPRRAGAPTDGSDAWASEELRRWHADSHLRLLRRRAAAAIAGRQRVRRPHAVG
jgi:hypothetical protein